VTTIAALGLWRLGVPGLVILALAAVVQVARLWTRR
jgi:hypothetical protein